MKKVRNKQLRVEKYSLHELPRFFIVDKYINFSVTTNYSMVYKSIISRCSMSYVKLYDKYESKITK